VVNSPEFAKLQATIIEALAPFPEARAGVVAQLRALKADSRTSVDVFHS
jgi:hypothetical protein